MRQQKQTSLYKEKLIMGRVSIEEMKAQTKKVDIKYIICAAVLLLLLIVLMVSTCTLGPDSGNEESTEVVKESWDTEIRINEVMTDNSFFAPAANGKYYDWIELYNSGENTVDLSGCYLSDNPEKLDKFLIEELAMEPGQYVLIYMSRLSGVDENGIIHTNFALSSLGESIYLSDAEGNILSVLTVPQGRSNISYGILDNKLVWMSTPTPGAENSGESSENLEALEYTTISIRINEYMTDNKSVIYDCEGDYNDWIELYNASGEAIDLSGYKMTDNSANVDKWEFPEGTVIEAGEYMLIFCSGKDKTDSAGYIHTSFRLGGDDVSVMIYSPQDQLCAETELVFIPDNSSYGYVTETDVQAYFSKPTPGKANTSPAVYYTEAQLNKMKGIYE